MSGLHYLPPVLCVYGIFTFEDIIHPFKMSSSGSSVYSQTFRRPPPKSASPLAAATPHYPRPQPLADSS